VRKQFLTSPCQRPLEPLAGQERGSNVSGVSPPAVFLVFPTKAQHGAQEHEWVGVDFFAEAMIDIANSATGGASLHVEKVL